MFENLLTAHLCCRPYQIQASRPVRGLLEAPTTESDFRGDLEELPWRRDPGYGCYPAPTGIVASLDRLFDIIPGASAVSRKLVR